MITETLENRKDARMAIVYHTFTGRELETRISRCNNTNVKVLGEGRASMPKFLVEKFSA